MEVIHTIGRRKASVARIYLKEGAGNIVVNGKDLAEYFDTPTLVRTVKDAFTVTGTEDRFDVKINVGGGGITGQAQAIRLAISRALCEINEEVVVESSIEETEEGEEGVATKTFRALLKAEGYLTRDSREVESKKPGLKKARKAPQFSKR